MDTDVHGFLGVTESRYPIVQQFSVLLEINTLVRRLTSIAFFKWLLLPAPMDTVGVGKIVGVRADPRGIFHVQLATKSFRLPTVLSTNACDLVHRRERICWVHLSPMV